MAQAVEVRRYDSLSAFEDRALSFLLARESEHNLFLGICHGIRTGRYADFYLATAEREAKIVAAAFRTPPFNLGLSHVDDPDAIASIADDVRTVYDALPGVLAARADAHAFAKLWDRRYEVAVEQRIYETSHVVPPQVVHGEMRNATMDDLDLVTDWFRHFNDDTLSPALTARLGDPAVLAEWRLSGAGGPLVLWCVDGDPVSMAGAGGPTPNGIRVNAVYTPPAQRRKGYASACVAALTRRLLNEGRRYCFLYTDLSNPTSNAIYQKIGYRPVCDVDEIRFTG
jgi:hypothetical protein